MHFSKGPERATQQLKGREDSIYRLKTFEMIGEFVAVKRQQLEDLFLTTWPKRNPSVSR